MISGIVSDDLDPLIRITVAGPGGTLDVEAIVDSGFNGHLALAPAVVANLDLEWLGLSPARMADGREEWFNVYRGTVFWHGRTREVSIEAGGPDALLGMRLMSGFSLYLESRPGGPVRIEPPPVLGSSNADQYASDGQLTTGN